MARLIVGGGDTAHGPARRFPDPSGPPTGDNLKCTSGEVLHSLKVILVGTLIDLCDKCYKNAERPVLTLQKKHHGNDSINNTGF